MVRGLAGTSSERSLPLICICSFVDATGERPIGPGLNHWHEGTFLAILGSALFFGYGRDLLEAWVVRRKEAH